MKKRSANSGANSARPASARRWLISLPILLFIAALLITAWELGAHSHPARITTPVAPKVETVNHVIKAQPGPWGELEYTRITIEVPDHFITITPPEPSRWFFKNFSKEQLTELFRSAHLTESQLDQALHKSEWKEDDNGHWIVPPEQLILEMSSEARQRIYSVLSLFPENPDQNGAFRFRPELLDERLEQSGIDDGAMQLFKKLLYPQSPYLFFADTDVVLARLKTEHEKMRFIKTISRRTSLLVMLKVNRDTDINALTKYWGHGGRAKDLRPILESLTRIPGGGAIDISHLLPPFVRQRIYTYPEPAVDAVAAKESCHWTSFNFFNLSPDIRFSDPEFATKEIENNYDPIGSPSQLGDLIFLKNSQGMAVHSAIYIAENIVFTKNGAGFNQPWIYTRIEDMLPIYLEPNDSIKVVAYRKKAFSVASLDGSQEN